MQGDVIFKQLLLIDCCVVGVNDLYEVARPPLETEPVGRKSEVRKAIWKEREPLSRHSMDMGREAGSSAFVWCPISCCVLITDGGGLCTVLICSAPHTEQPRLYFTVPLLVSYWEDTDQLHAYVIYVFSTLTPVHKQYIKLFNRSNKDELFCV